MVGKDLSCKVNYGKEKYVYDTNLGAEVCSLKSMISIPKEACLRPIQHIAQL